MAFWKIFGKKKSPQDLLAAGDLKGALKGFQVVLKQKKSFDPALVIQVAGIHTKLGNLEEAKNCYMKVGEHYGDAGFFNKSVAAFKKALNLFPEDQGILDKLASYNDKVPKFMIDEKFLRKINRWEEEANQAGDVDVDFDDRLDGEDALDGDGLATITDMSDEPPSLEDPTDFVRHRDAPINGAAEEAGIADPNQSGMDIDMSFLGNEGDDTFDVDDETMDQTFDNPDIDMDFNPVNESPEPEVTPVMDLIPPSDEDDAILDVSAAELPPIVEETPSIPIDLPEDSIPEDDIAQRAAHEPNIEDTGNRMVFKSRIEDEKPKDNGQQQFDSVDDALDSLFGGDDEEEGGLFGGLGAAEPEPAPEPELAPEPEASEAHAEPERVQPAEPAPESVAAATAVPVVGNTDESVDFTAGELHFLEEEDDFVNPFDAASDEENQRHWALFRTMPKEVFTAFVVALDMSEYEPDQYLMKQGDTGAEMFLISEGEVAVEIEKSGEVATVAKLGEGDFVGEASLLTGAPRNASVKALAPTTCLILKGHDLNQLTEDHPSVMESIKSIYYTRIRQNASRFRQNAEE